MLNEKLLKKVAEKLDDLIDWKKITGKPVLGSILEIADNYGFPKGLEYLNVKFGDKISANYLEPLEKALQSFVEGDYEGILLALPESLDKVFDVPGLDEDLEAIWITTNFKAVLAFIKLYAVKKLK